MDIFAHSLWAGVGMALLSAPKVAALRHPPPQGGARKLGAARRFLERRRRPIAPRTVALTMALAALPDVLHLLPIVGWWWFGDGTTAVLQAYAMAVPDQEPALPPLVGLWSHHLHCIAHSAVVAGAVTLLLWAVRRSLWLPLLGWWLHIVIDVFTHSADYYAVPVLYPFTERGFDGLAWNTPWFMALNYAALAATGLWLLWSRGRGHAR